MSKTSKSRLLAIAALTTTNLIWAAAIPIAKKAFNEGLTPELFLFVRFLIAFIFCLPILFYLKNHGGIKQYFKTPTFLLIFGLEFLGTFVSLFLLYAGLSRSSAIDATLLTTTLPLFIAIGGVVFLKERESNFEILGLGLSFLGALVLIFNGGLLTLDLKSPGNMLIFLHNISVSAYYLLAKKYYKKINKFYVSGLGFLVGTIFFGLSAKIDPTNITSTLSNLGPWSTLAIVYMAIFGSIIALTFYLYGQDKIEASEAAIFNYLNPVFAIPLSFLLLGETIGRKEMIAGTLILLGVTLAQKRKK